jgi:hypothetical protein
MRGMSALAGLRIRRHLERLGNEVVEHVGIRQSEVPRLHG